MLDKVKKIIEPVISEMNYELYYLEYVKEDGEYYLRIYIDSDNGISLDDCEKVSRRISEEMDKSDPIPDAYYLEVSSPGIERGLYTDKHLNKYIGSEIVIKLSEPLQGKKSLQGKLLEFDDESITASIKDESVKIPRDIIKSINLWVKY